MPAPKGREKVAVLGGGPAAVTAAFQLSAPELNQRFDVTVYQPGWRLGGKCASGRNLDEHRAGRIEEHGLHVWFGFYDNAFSVMRRAYEELERPLGHPLRTLEDAFKGCDEIVLYDRQGSGWVDLGFQAPSNEQIPGKPADLPGFWDIAKWMCEWAKRAYEEAKAEHADVFGELASEPSAPATHWDLLSVAAHLHAGAAAPAGEHLLDLAHGVSRAAQAGGTPHLPRALLARAPSFQALLGKSAEHVLVGLLCGFRDWLWEHVVRDHVQAHPHLRLFFTIFDTFASATAGIVEDGVLQKGWDAINSEDLCAWLKRHGAKQVTLGKKPAERSPVLRSIYDVAFGYPGGDIEKANIAAGTAMNDFLRLNFSYRGSLMYKMQAGMGDTVLAPFYLALKKRGVKFEFFHAVKRLGLSADGKDIETVEIVRQVELSDTRPEAVYDPLVPVGGLECWPSEPRWEQLSGGEKLRGSGLDFELEINPLNRPPEPPLRRGKDFDHVVLGIPVGALAPICGELAEHLPRFAEMLENAVTVPTQAFQLWLSKTPSALGWAHSENSVAGTYTEPLDTWCDMTHLLGREEWRARDGVAGVAYFCGVLEDRPKEQPAAAKDRVKRNAAAFLKSDLAGIWPKAVKKGGAIDWSALADPGRSAAGAGRLDSQYWRANVAPSERYVLTPAGSVGHRLRAGESGFGNLVLAGDWTRNGIDGGCVEAAVTSGMQAAQALIGTSEPISGESETWLSERRTGHISRPPALVASPPSKPATGAARAPVSGALASAPEYVEYGGRATAPPPFLSTEGRFRGYLLTGEQKLIADMVERMFNGPAAGKVVYRPLFGEHVLLQTGAFGKVSSQAPGFEHWGYVEEAQISLWIPVIAGRLDGGAFVPQRLCMAVPYILVNNPMSYAGGREDYGYPKSLGIFEPIAGIGDPLTVQAFGGNFAPGNRADWHTLFRLARSGRGEPLATHAARPAPAERRWHQLADAARHLHALPAPHRLELPELSLLKDILAVITGKQMRQVFLKQFRDVQATSNACYQAVVEAPIHYLSTTWRPLLERWQVDIALLDSHPIGRELGVFSQATSLSFEVRMDMIAEPGTVIAP